MDDKLSLSSKNVYDNNGGIKMHYKTGLIGLLTIGAMYFGGCKSRSQQIAEDEQESKTESIMLPSMIPVIPKVNKDSLDAIAKQDSIANAIYNKKYDEFSKIGKTVDIAYGMSQLVTVNGELNGSIREAGYDSGFRYNSDGGLVNFDPKNYAFNGDVKMRMFIESDLERCLSDNSDETLRIDTTGWTRDAPNSNYWHKDVHIKTSYDKKNGKFQLDASKGGKSVSYIIKDVRVGAAWVDSIIVNDNGRIARYDSDNIRYEGDNPHMMSCHEWDTQTHTVFGSYLSAMMRTTKKITPTL